jgi:hypothetical protein
MPLSQADQWREAHLVTAPAAPPPGALPLVAIICDGCACTLLFAAHTIGIQPP